MCGATQEVAPTASTPDSLQAMSTPQSPVGRDLELSDSFEVLVARAAELAESDEHLMYSLVEARKAAGMTQRDVAALLGIAQPTVAKFEAHDSDPKLSTIRRYALTVGAHVEHVVTTREPVNPVRAWLGSDAPRVPVDLAFGISAPPVDEVTATAEAGLRSDYTIAA